MSFFKQVFSKCPEVKFCSYILLKCCIIFKILWKLSSYFHFQDWKFSTLEKFQKLEIIKFIQKWEEICWVYGAPYLNLAHSSNHLRQCATKHKWKQIWTRDTIIFTHQLTVLCCVLYILFTKWYKIIWNCVSCQLMNEAAECMVAAAIQGF